jgi:ACS family pantothenate transporter-like MFS transporter
VCLGTLILELEGLAESTFYPGMQYIIGSWYRRDELAKRSCIFHTSSGIASMFSGYLMDAVYHLGGRGGFKGWQWYAKYVSLPLKWTITLKFIVRLFVIDGVISLPVAISGFFLLPDVPEISNPWYLSKEVCWPYYNVSQIIEHPLTLIELQEVALAQKRMKLEGRQDRGPFTKAKLKKIFSSWHIYLLTLLYVFVFKSRFLPT